MVKRGGFRGRGGGRFRSRGRGKGNGRGRGRRDDEGFKNTRRGSKVSKRKFKGPEKEDKLDDMMDSYWGKSTQEKYKDNIKKINDEILNNNLESYWAKKTSPKLKLTPAQEAQEEAKK